MLNVTLIHYLLVAILVFSQFASHVHNTSHFHDHTGHTHYQSEYQSEYQRSFALNHSQLKGSKQSFTPNHEHSDVKLADHTQTEKTKNDCSIYHILLNMNGGFLAAHTVDQITPFQCAGANHTPHVMHTSIRDYENIRAPPLASWFNTII